MPENPQTPAPEKPITPYAAAVKHCMDAYKQALRGAATMGADEYTKCKAGADAYRLAMPCMESPRQIRAFIACVAHGITFEIWKPREPTQLLYAAQVALAAHKSRKAPQKTGAPADKGSRSRDNSTHPIPM
jgi:hypothetical protein